jgi:hypothetical protein
MGPLSHSRTFSPPGSPRWRSSGPTIDPGHGGTHADAHAERCSGSSVDTKRSWRPLSAQ